MTRVPPPHPSRRCCGRRPPRARGTRGDPPVPCTTVRRAGTGARLRGATHPGGVGRARGRVLHDAATCHEEKWATSGATSGKAWAIASPPSVRRPAWASRAQSGRTSRTSSAAAQPQHELFGPGVRRSGRDALLPGGRPGMAAGASASPRVHQGTRLAWPRASTGLRRHARPPARLSSPKREPVAWAPPSRAHHMRSPQGRMTGKGHLRKRREDAQTTPRRSGGRMKVARKAQLARQRLQAIRLQAAGAERIPGCHPR